MPRKFSELKSGGTIPMLSAHAEKRGTRPPSVPHRSTPVCTGNRRICAEQSAQNVVVYVFPSLMCNI